MELLPILEPEDKPREKQWYALVPRGQCPGVSVGHTCTFLPFDEGGKGKIVIVGGANPNGSFSESSVIDLDRHEWDIPEWEGLQARYEHCSFSPEGSPRSLWVFAGAEQSGNRNCVQVLQLADSGSWRNIQATGEPPSPRTYHTSTACVGHQLFVFSGGDAGSTPVADPQLHVFDTGTSTWSQPATKGKPPSPRHGHVVVAVGTTIFIHGGLEGDKFHSDMYSLDTVTMRWEKVKTKGDVPSGRASHCAVTLRNCIYIFGGMMAEGATNSMYKFHTGKHRWTLMKFEGDLPSNRLDHSMCVVPWCVRTESAGEGDTAQSRKPEDPHLCFVFGGMDTEGVIFNDCLVTVLT
ncbi:rab9 effector protein with kelch motifs isoform X2 [Clupea harengus]|uniref:Rab9 effector protein with kelch motifs n=1 Tax=Clupea harengus TaxID=7950 RepID=A0A6P3VF49_CLUHA|nr:rab9 effector protein with kelch motifs isoform X2 [Clupea harengus]